MPASFASACARSRALALVVLLAVLLPAVAAGAAHHGDRTLHHGARGHDVRVLQDLLSRAGLRTPVAGTFDHRTRHNVRRFQRRHGLVADGVARPRVLRALRTTVAHRAQAQRRARAQGRAKRFGYRFLRKGMSGADVRVLQHQLTRAGIRTPVVGYFGRRTHRSVRRFERVYGLRVDGVVGAGDAGTLRRVGAPGAELGPPGKARLRGDGTAVAPIDAPVPVRAVIAAANRIAKTPYVWGGGHGGWSAGGYDCSGSVSYALHGGGLLAWPLTSGGLMSWGSPGRGRWITVYAHGAHTFMVVAGLRFDTSGASPSRWQTDMRSSGGFAIRHPAGL
ncbi:MAG TPA: peptidoglycan-binding protein [Conexibacter sp.]|nr:peptidoglycan-binding protein [Conexibacter sp.]